MKRWRFWWAIFVIVGVLLIVFSALSAHAQPYGAVQDGPIASDAALVVRHGAHHLDSVWRLPDGWTVCREMERCGGGEFARSVWMPEPSLQRAQIALEGERWLVRTSAMSVVDRSLASKTATGITGVSSAGTTGMAATTISDTSLISAQSLTPARLLALTQSTENSPNESATASTRRRPSDPPSAPSPSCVAHPESVAEAHKYASCNDGKWTDPNCRGYEWVERACDAIYQWRHQDTTKRVEFDFYVWASAQYDQDGALYDSPAADCPWSLSLHRPDWAARSTVVMVTYNGRYRSERTFELQPVGCTDCTVAVILPCYRQAPMVNLNWSVR